MAVLATYHSTSAARSLALRELQQQHSSFVQTFEQPAIPYSSQIKGQHKSKVTSTQTRHNRHIHTSRAAILDNGFEPLWRTITKAFLSIEGHDGVHSRLPIRAVQSLQVRSEGAGQSGT